MEFLGLILLVLALLIVAPILSIVAMVKAGKSESTLRAQQQQIQYLLHRLSMLEKGAGQAPPPVPPAPAPAPTPAVQPAPAPIPVPQPVTPPGPPPERRAPIMTTPIPEFTAPSLEGEMERLEEKFGKRWITWVGVAALFLGVAFFVKYAFDNQWIGPTARIILGLAFGGLLLVAGDQAMRRAYRALGEGLFGGGLAIMYLSLFAGFSTYHLMPSTVAFLLMVCLTALGMTLAVVHNARALNVLAILGGFMTPVMISTGTNARDLLMIYLLLLDLGVLGVAFFKEWRVVDTLAFVGTWLLFYGWYQQYYASTALAPTLLWVSLFYLVFLVLPLVYHFRHQVPVAAERVFLVLLNATIAFTFAYQMLIQDYRFLLGFIALAISATSLLMGWVTRRKLPGDATALFGFVALAVTFLTLAIPLQLKTYGIAMLWAVEAPVLLYLGYRFRYYPVRVGAFLVSLLAVMRLFVAHWPLHHGEFIPVFNGPFAGAISIPITIGAYAVIHYLWRKAATETDNTLKIVSGIGAGLLGLFLVQSEIGLWIARVYNTDVSRALTATIWALGGLLFVLIGVHMRHLVVQATGIFPLVIAGVLGVMMYGNGVEAGYPLFLNPRFGAALFIVLSLFFSWWTMYRADKERDMQQFLFGTFELALFIFLSLEVFFFSRNVAAAGQAGWLSQMALSITWGVYAIALLVAGFWRTSRGMRITALCIFGATALKLLIVDISYLQQIYRIISFIIIGLLMIGASYLYHHLEKRLRVQEEETE